MEKSCFVYKLICDRCSEIAGINEQRIDAACTVFGSEIVVTGGLYHVHDN